jgi:hypothetical protein
MQSFINKILSDKTLYDKLKSTWAYYRNNGALTEEALTQVVDDKAAELDQSQKLNFQVWPIMNQNAHLNPVIWGSYQSEVKHVKDYITARINWIDNKLQYVPTALRQTQGIKINHWVETGTLHLENLSEGTTVRLFDLSGRPMQTMSTTGNLSISLNPGSYLVRISNLRGENVVVKCLVP